MQAVDKRRLYQRIVRELKALIADLDDEVAVMASTVAVVHQAVPYASWTGFYRVVAPELLRVGPYQGPVGCLEIPFDRGVCGAAARLEATQIVDDVHAFDGHIACDPRSRSEIVVPVHDRRGRLAAVLDLDSHDPAAFGAADQDGLETVAHLLRDHLLSPLG